MTSIFEAEKESSQETCAAGTLNLAFQPPEPWENKCLLFKPANLSILLWKSDQTNTLAQQQFSNLSVAILCALSFVNII